MGRGRRLSVIAAAMTLLAVAVPVGLNRLAHAHADAASDDPIKVGVLHSLTGSVAIIERPMTDATLMAIEELNEAGGVLGRKVEPIVVDGKSDWPTFAAETEQLIDEEDVPVIFGGYTSASRKTIVPIIEDRKNVLFYPTLYEGLEASPNVVYTGAAPNQFIIPAIKWFLDNRGHTFFLVGSDYIFPRSSNAIIKDQLAYLGGEVVGEEYIPLGSADVEPMIQKILETQPDVIVSTVVGDSNVPFFEQLGAAGVTPRDIPTLSVVLTESELQSLDTQEMAGNYIGLNYFQSVETRENAEFVERYKEKFGDNSVLSDPMEASYVSVHLWAQAVRDAGSADPEDVLRAVRGQSFDAPGGRVFVDDVNLHTWKSARIAEIQADGQVNIIWTSETLIHPVPYAVYRTRREWEEMLQELYVGWNGSWAAP